jgi:hypothetical protein
MIDGLWVDARQIPIRPPEAERASSDRYSCRIASARTANPIGNEPAKTCRSPGHHISAAIQIRAGQKSYQRQPPLKALGVPVTFLFRGPLGDRCGGARAQSAVQRQMDDLRFFIELLLWLALFAADFGSRYVSLRTIQQKNPRSGDKAALRGPPPGAKRLFPEDGREPTRRRLTVNVRGVPRWVNVGCTRRGAPHEPRWSVASTVRQLKEPKISHFDQLGCSRIGRKTARKSSTVK